MAIFHYSAQVISRSAGKSSVAAAAYRSGSGIYDEQTGIDHDYTKKQGVDHTEILAPEGAPDWVFDRELLWNQVEKKEQRKDSQLAYEINVALPIELDQAQRIDLLREFIQTEFVSQGLVVDYAVHNDNPDNPHAHIMTTTRPLEGDTFGKKPKAEEFRNRKDALNRRRETWAISVNQALENAGRDERIDHRSFAELGIDDQVPQIHLGATVAAMRNKGIPTDRGDLYDEIATQNWLLKLAAIEAEIKALESDLDHEDGTNSLDIQPRDELEVKEEKEGEKIEDKPQEGELIEQLSISNELPASLDSGDLVDSSADPDTTKPSEEPPSLPSEDAPAEIAPLIAPPAEAVDELEDLPDLADSISIGADMRPGVDDALIAPLTVEPPAPPILTPAQKTAQDEYDTTAAEMRAAAPQSVLTDEQVAKRMSALFHMALKPNQSLSTDQALVLSRSPLVQITKQSHGEKAARERWQEVIDFGFHYAQSQIKTPPPVKGGDGR